MVLLRLLIFVLWIQCVHASCPDGFDLVNGQECRGKYAHVDTFYDEVENVAISKCSEILASPIIIHDDEEQEYWAAIMRRPYWYTTVLGLACNRTSKRWQWADGSPLDYKPPDYNNQFDIEECDFDAAAIIGITGYWGIGWGTGSSSPYATDIYCAMPLRQPLLPADGCNDSGADDEDGVCYQVAFGATSGNNAQSICESISSTVASVHNARENSFLRRLAVSQGAVSGLLLGASVKGSDFEWLDGSQWDYDHFYPGFPMTGMGECLMMDTGGTAGDWANVDCSTNLAVACMRRQTYQPPECSAGPWVEGQVIYSPGYPYDASTPCDFILSVDAGKRVELEIQVLEANPCCDRMIVYENYFGSNIVANLTGIVNDKVFTTSSSNFMRVSWQPNGGQNVKGVMMTFRGV